MRVNAVNPGVVATNLFRAMNQDQLKEFIERNKETHPLGRIGDGIEIAKAIAFLASDDASFITGMTLSIDGGKHLMCPL